MVSSSGSLIKHSSLAILRIVKSKTGNKLPLTQNMILSFKLKIYIITTGGNDRLHKIRGFGDAPKKICVEKLIRFVSFQHKSDVRS
jgi:hypothetical protein